MTISRFPLCGQGQRPLLRLAHQAAPLLQCAFLLRIRRCFRLTLLLSLQMRPRHLIRQHSLPHTLTQVQLITTLLSVDSLSAWLMYWLWEIAAWSRPLKFNKAAVWPRCHGVSPKEPHFQMFLELGANIVTWIIHSTTIVLEFILEWRTNSVITSIVQCLQAKTTSKRRVTYLNIDSSSHMTVLAPTGILWDQSTDFCIACIPNSFGLVRELGMKCTQASGVATEKRVNRTWQYVVQFDDPTHWALEGRILYAYQQWMYASKTKFPLQNHPTSKNRVEVCAYCVSMYRAQTGIAPDVRN